MSEQFYLDIKGQTVGPLSLESVRQLYLDRAITPETLYTQVNAVQWNRVEMILSLLHAKTPDPVFLNSIISKRPIKYSDRFKWVCDQCGHIDIPISRRKGSGWITFILLFWGIVPGLIYWFWRNSNRYNCCTACESRDLYPIQSPRGQSEFELVNIPEAGPSVFYILGNLVERASVTVRKWISISVQKCQKNKSKEQES